MSIENKGVSNPEMENINNSLSENEELLKTKEILEKKRNYRESARNSRFASTMVIPAKTKVRDCNQLPAGRGRKSKRLST